MANDQQVENEEVASIITHVPYKDYKVTKVDGENAHLCKKSFHEDYHKLPGCVTVVPAVLITGVQGTYPILGYVIV